MKKQKTAPRKNYAKGIRTYFILSAVVLIAAGVYGYFQFTKLMEVQSAIASGKTTLTELQAAESQNAEIYSSQKNNYDEQFSTIKESINEVFPAEEDYTDLTRRLDEFMSENNNTTLNPIFMSDLKFSQPRIDQENGYAVLPFSLSLSTTRENLENFLAFIESSGSLENRIRLMEVKSISLNFPNQEITPFAGTEDITEIPTMNVSVNLNAYFQAPPDTPDAN